MGLTDIQQRAFAEHYGDRGAAAYEFEGTDDAFVRYARDRRILIALNKLAKLTAVSPEHWKVLILCSGPGGEGSVLANVGFKHTVVTDFCEEPLELARSRDPRLRTARLDAEDIELPDGSYDLVIVQDGLHHLPRPTLGLTEMLRVAKRAVIAIEPGDSIVTRVAGTRWEVTAKAINYVFRWTPRLFEQVVRSVMLLGGGEGEAVARAGGNQYLPYRLPGSLDQECRYQIRTLRLWDHHAVMMLLYRILHSRRVALLVARLVYACLAPFNAFGNAFIGVVVKGN